MRIALATLSYLITVVALGLLAIRVPQLVSIYRKGQPDPTRRDNPGARLKNMLKEILGHTKMLNFTATGIAHWFVMPKISLRYATPLTSEEKPLCTWFAMAQCVVVPVLNALFRR